MRYTYNTQTKLSDSIRTKKPGFTTQQWIIRVSTLKDSTFSFLNTKTNQTNLYPLHVVFIRFSLRTAGIHSCLVSEDQLCVVHRLEIQAVMMQLARVEHSSKKQNFIIGWHNNGYGKLHFDSDQNTGLRMLFPSVPTKAYFVQVFLISVHLHQSSKITSRVF